MLHIVLYLCSVSQLCRLQVAPWMQVQKSMLAEWTQSTTMHTKCWVVLEGERLKVLMQYTQFIPYIYVYVCVMVGLLPVQ